MQVKASFKAHDGHIQAVSVSPNDGKYVATGGRDRKLNIWDVTDLSQPSRSFDAKSQINQIAFNPKLQWVAAGTETGIRIWDLYSSNTNPVSTLKPEIPKVEGKLSFLVLFFIYLIMFLIFILTQFSMLNSQF